MKKSGKVNEIDYLALLKETVQAEILDGMSDHKIDYQVLLS